MMQMRLTSYPLLLIVVPSRQTLAQKAVGDGPRAGLTIYLFLALPIVSFDNSRTLQSRNTTLLFLA